MNSVVRYNPRSVNAFGSFDRVFDSLFRANTGSVLGRPAVDIRESEEGYVLEAELPGFNESDVEVNLNDNLLTITASTETKDDEKANGYVLRERRSRAFTRSFVLPSEVDREKIDAKFADGVLTLELHKTPESKPRRIEIKKEK